MANELTPEQKAEKIEEDNSFALAQLGNGQLWSYAGKALFGNEYNEMAQLDFINALQKEPSAETWANFFYPILEKGGSIDVYGLPDKSAKTLREVIPLLTAEGVLKYIGSEESSLEKYSGKQISELSKEDQKKWNSLVMGYGIDTQMEKLVGTSKGLKKSTLEYLIAGKEPAQN